MASVSLDGLKTSIISNVLQSDAKEEVFLPFVPSINTITANTSNDGNVVTVTPTTQFAQSTTVTIEVPKYGLWDACAFEADVAGANPAILDANDNGAGTQHGAYAAIEFVELRSQGKKLLSWSGRGMSSILQNYLSKTQYQAVANMSGNGTKTKSLWVVPLPAMFDKKLALNTVLLDRMELVIRFAADGATTARAPNATGSAVHFWYRQVDPETDAAIRAEVYSKGNRSMLMFDCQSYGVVGYDNSNKARTNLTSQKLVRCHYVDEYTSSANFAARNYLTAVAAQTAHTDSVLISAGGRAIYQSSKVNAILNHVILGREINNPRSLCIDYRNGILKGSSSDYSSGLALRHLPNPTLEINGIASGGAQATAQMQVHEEAYVLVGLDALSGRISVTAEN